MNPMESTYDVYISFFRDLEIRTAGSTLTEQIINAPKTIQLIAYLLLNPERAHSPREIFEHLNLGKDFGGNTNAIRGSIYLCCLGDLLLLKFLLICTCLYMRSVYEYCAWVYCPVIYCLIQDVLEYFCLELREKPLAECIAYRCKVRYSVQQTIP